MKSVDFHSDARTQWAKMTRRGCRLAAASLALALGCAPAPAWTAAAIEGFTAGGQFREQVRSFKFEPGVSVLMVAPPAGAFDPQRPTTLVIYALPNGNTTEETMGKAPGPGVGWRFDIQHIGAQTRVLRAATSDRNLVVAYLENDQKSWPSWRKAHQDSGALMVAILEKLKAALPGPAPEVCLTGHSGGGSFIFGYIDAVETIPASVSRIAFLDSNYPFDAAAGHSAKLIRWLRGDSFRRLIVLAYDDRNIELNGKKVVSETGGTYRATLRMIEAFRPDMPLEEGRAGSYLRFSAPQVEMLIHPNPENLVLHTALVGERNGFIYALTAGVSPRASWQKSLASLEGPRAYTGWIERPAPARMAPPDPAIPPRPANARGGVAFIEAVKDLEREAREAAVLRELLRGNIPGHLRRLVPVTVKAKAIDGAEHTAVFEAMPDYLAIGSDADYVRMPMNPHTAQAFCDAFGFVLPTRKMVDDIWRQAVSKIVPQPLTEERESPLTFLRHHRLIEEQIAGQYLGELRAGHKKDVVITNRLKERPSRLAIYGWHFPSGQPIQPLTIVHVDWYVDYSHGIRPVKKTIKVDGADLPYQQVLQDPHLHPLLSDEGVIDPARYPSPQSR